MKITNDIINAITAAQTVLVCGHIRPDGDCIGAALAMRAICEKLGKTADAVCDAEKPVAFEFLPDYGKFCIPRFKSYDLFIAVDCANDKRLGVYREMLLSAKNTVDIDHHPTNNRYGNINHIDGNACSTCALLFEMFENTGLIDKNIATMLYTGLSTDTGHFMHSNTTDVAFDTAAKLYRLGVDVGAVNHGIYCNKSFNKIKLTARALGAISLHNDGTVALLVITCNDLDECGCKSEDTEGLIDFASSISGVKISVSMCEQPGNVYRVSFRSVSADVAACAEKFGGGGHRLAAGCIMVGNRYDIMENLISAATAAVRADSERTDQSV